ncbi:MAG: TonB-dependent receptor, partial [Bacteroidota bacterium]
MKTKITLLFVGLFGLCLNSYAQSGTAGIKGSVTDPEGEIVAFANIILNKSLDSTVAKVGYTDESGQFAIDRVPSGAYWLTISYVGVPDWNTEVFDLVDNQVFELLPVQLKPASEELAQVTITAQRPLLEVKPDKTVFNVDGSINAVGNTAFELLRKAPGVVIDNNENVTMLGRNGVQIYINGKPSPLQGADLANFLKSMNSTEIDAIELITNPSAKYDAAGNAGIINIKLKKDKTLGANGSLNMGGGVGQAEAYNASINGNFRDKKVNLFGSYGFNDGAGINTMNIYREQSGLTFDQSGVNSNYWVSHNIKLGADYFLNEKNTIGFMANGNLNTNENTNFSRTPISMIGSPTIDSILVAENISEGTRNNFNYNLNYAFNGEGKSLNIDLDYGMFRRENEAFQP